MNWELDLLFNFITKSFSIVQFYLPDDHAVTKDFLRDILVGKKHLLQKSAVDYVTVPEYDELSVVALFPTLRSEKEFMQYLPDKYPKGKNPPRDYFFNVLNTVHPEYLAQLMAHASEQRMSAHGAAQKDETIKITQYWDEQLKKMPYLSRSYLITLFYSSIIFI